MLIEVQGGVFDGKIMIVEDGLEIIRFPKLKAPLTMSQTLNHDGLLPNGFGFDTEEYRITNKYHFENRIAVLSDGSYVPDEITIQFIKMVERDILFKKIKVLSIILIALLIFFVC